MAAGFDAEVAATRVRVVVESTDGTSGWLSVGTALRAAAVSDAKSVFAAVAVPGAVLGLAGQVFFVQPPPVVLMADGSLDPVEIGQRDAQRTGQDRGTGLGCTLAKQEESSVALPELATAQVFAVQALDQHHGTIQLAGSLENTLHPGAHLSA